MAEEWSGILPPLDIPEAGPVQQSTGAKASALPITRQDESGAVEDPSFSYEGYQVVRGEYFAHINEPSVSLADYKITVNHACLKKLPNIDYVQVLMNAETHKMVIRPSSEDQKDAFSWRTATGKPRSITCRGFFAMLLCRLNWDPDYRYKFLGRLIKSNGEYLFVFDLDGPEIYQRQMITDESGKARRKTKRTPVYREEWQNQFGVPVQEHQKAVQINIFDGYAVFSVGDTRNKDEAAQQPEGGAP